MKTGSYPFHDISIPELNVDPFSAESLGDPQCLYSAALDMGPVFYIPLYDVFGSARFDVVSAALKDWKNFTSERGVGLADFARDEPWRPKSLLLETDPPLHDHIRSIANRVLSPGVLKAVREEWSVEADKLIGELVAKGFFDGITELAEVFPQRVFAPAIGLREDGREHLIPYATANFNAFGPRNAIFYGTEPQRLAAAPWIEESCTRRLIRPGSWGAAFFAAADRGECTEEQAARLTRSLITAGFDTTINAIGHALDVLADEPEAWAAVHANPALAKRAFEEALRLRSPVQNFFRTTTGPVSIEGFVLPPGSKILLMLGAANRDPRRWAEAARFDLYRNTSGHVAFGFGVHQCLGQMVARQEGEIILAALARGAAGLTRAGPAKRRPNNTLNALSSLPLSVA